MLMAGALLVTPSTTPAEAADGGVPGRAEANAYCHLRKEIKL